MVPPHHWFWFQTIFPRWFYRFITPGLVSSDWAFSSAAERITAAMARGELRVQSYAIDLVEEAGVFFKSPTFCQDLYLGAQQSSQTMARQFNSADDKAVLQTSSFYTSLVPALLLNLFFCFWAALQLYSLVGMIRYVRGYGGKIPTMYIVDFAVFQDFAPSWRVKPDIWFPHVEKELGLSTESCEFAKKVFGRSGIGSPTHLPPTLLSCPPQLSMAAGRLEAMIILSGTQDALFARTGFEPRDVDILITNCSLFNPTPSHTAMITRHYNMRSDIQTFSLAGMGCSASHIAADCARAALIAHPKKDAIAVVVSYENLTQNFYLGDARQMSVANAQFRMGGAAIMYTKQDSIHGLKAKYRVEQLVRESMSADSDAYACVYQDSDEAVRSTDLTKRQNQTKLPEDTNEEEESSGARFFGTGVRLSKAVPKVASKGLTKVMTKIATQSLSWKLIISYVCRQVFYTMHVKAGCVVDKSTVKHVSIVYKPLQWLFNLFDSKVDAKLPPVPAFHKAFEHVLIHAGGKAVVQGISDVLNLSVEQKSTSERTLRKYGNTSGSSLWYNLYEAERQDPFKHTGASETWEEDDHLAAVAKYNRGARYEGIMELMDKQKDSTQTDGEGSAYTGMRAEEAVALAAGPMSRCMKSKKTPQENQADKRYADQYNYVTEEKREGVQPGERAWLIFFGSGFKIGGMVLRRL